MIPGTHFEGFVKGRISRGRFESTSEVVQAGLRLPVDEETRLRTLRNPLEEGEEIGIKEYPIEVVLREFNLSSQRFSSRKKRKVICSI